MLPKMKFCYPLNDFGGLFLKIFFFIFSKIKIDLKEQK